MSNPPEDKKPDIATQIMQSMVRMPPKPHDEMKIGERKPKDEEAASTKRKKSFRRK
jgi:hypothetical protein